MTQEVAESQDVSGLSSVAQRRLRAHLRLLLERVFSRADDELFRLADTAHSNQEQNDWFDVMRRLRTVRPEVEASLLQELDGLGAFYGASPVQVLLPCFQRALGELQAVSRLGVMLAAHFREELDGAEFKAVWASAVALPDKRDVDQCGGGEQDGCNRGGVTADSQIESLFELLLNNPLLGRAQRELLALFKGPMEALWLQERGFLADEEHPARQLLNELTVALLRADDTGAFEEAFAGPLEEMARSMFDRGCDRQAFANALIAFRQLSDGVGQETLSQRLQQAELGRARADMARAFVSARIDESAELALGDGRLPDVVKEILQGPWHKVMLTTYLKEGAESPQWRQQLETLKALVRSVSGNFESPGALMVILPDLLGGLRQGFETVAYDSSEINPLLGRLEQLHLRLLQGKPLESEAQPLNGADEPLPEESPDDVGGATDSELEWASVVSRLTPGACIDVVSEGGEDRWRLAAHIKEADKLVFVDRAGRKAAELTSGQLAAMLGRGDGRLLDGDRLFEEALQAVVTGLRRPAT